MFLEDCHGYPDDGFPLSTFWEKNTFGTITEIDSYGYAALWDQWTSAQVCVQEGEFVLAVLVGRGLCQRNC